MGQGFHLPADHGGGRKASFDATRVSSADTSRLYLAAGALGIPRFLPDSLSHISYSPIFKNSTVKKLERRGFVFLPHSLISQASHSSKHHLQPLSAGTFTIKRTFDFSFPLQSLHSDDS